MFKIFRTFMALLLALSWLSAPAGAGENSAGEQLSPETPAEAPLLALSSAISQPWQLAELLGQAVPGEDDAPYLLLTNSDDLVGFGGCNFFIGKYRTGEEGRITVSSLRASHQQCPGLSERETSLLTSLVMANSLQVREEGLTFTRESSILMRLRPAPEISVPELLQQGRLIKAKALKKSRSKKKKAASKTKRQRKRTTAKSSSRTPPGTKKPVKPVKRAKAVKTVKAH